MKILIACLFAALTLISSSCVPSTPELPADQANKQRLHRLTPAEDLQETNRARGGSPMPATSEGSWKF
jgi:hypothetical protein